MGVPARLSLITLGVRDVATSTAFYQALGWPLSSASVPGTVSFFHTAGGLLSIFGRSDLAGDAHLDDAEPPAFRGISLAINLETEAAVDATISDVVTAGGRVVREPSRAFWGGYTAYFADPDGHLWEVAHNPGWPIGEDGRPQLPQ